MNNIIDKEKVHEEMKKKNIRTQQELAKRMGITKNQVSVLLSPKANPFKSNYLKLCDALGVDPIQLLKQPDKSIVEEACVGDEKESYVDTAHIKAKRPYNSVELFAGAGGLALGLEQAGFKELGLVEFDRYAAESLRVNRPNWNVIEEDIISVAQRGIRNYLNCDAEIDFVS